jgi:hypothetical protein
MKKRLFLLTLSLLGVAGALTIGVRPAEAACGYVCSNGCCDYCCTTSTGKLICSERPVCG